MTVRLNSTGWAMAVTATVAILTSSCGFKHLKYENPITKDTQQPDKALYDKAIKDLEKGRYELSRLTLNTLINTYESSEFLAKAKLAIADSWYREGGVSGLAQAEAEYKDFELFYPTMPEAAESQYKICKLHSEQMSKPDRDTQQALRSEQECKQLVLQYPNSKFVPEAEQLLRNIDEVLAEGEMRSANFYFGKGSRSAAANRYSGLVTQYPLYSRADEALWRSSEEYLGLGARWRPNAGQALQKIVRDYPLSIYAEQAKKKLREMELEVPEADPAAVARMKYEQDNRVKPSTFKTATGFLRPGPDVSMAAKTGSPAMNPPKQNIPVNVPSAQTTGAAGFQGDVTVAPVTNASGTAAGPTASVDGAKPTDKTTDPAAATTPNSAKADTASTNSKDKKKADKKASKKDTKNPKQDPSQAPAAAPAAAPAPDPGPKP
jgi:outer membrane protein assembly factor BamD